jgi:hypothetical protein
MRTAVLTAALSLSLTGCGLLPQGGSPGSSPSAPTSQGASDQPTEDLGTLTGAGRPLDEGGLRAALPAASDLGDGWVDDPMKTVFETAGADVTPATCAPLLQKGPEWEEAKQSQRARVQANFKRSDNLPPPGTERHFLGVWAYSFDDPYPAHLFDEAGSRIADCPTFDVRQVDTGSTSSYAASPLSFPTLGDRTLSLRLTIQQTYETFTLDFVMIKIGHNTISVANGTYNGTPDAAVTEEAARAALAGLEE